MKSLYPGLLIFGGCLGLMSGTDSHPPKVAAAPSIAPAKIEAPPLVAPAPSSEPVSSDEQGDAGGGAETGESDAYSKRAATSLPASFPTVAEQMLAEANRIGPYRTLDVDLCKAAQYYANYLAATGKQGHFADGDPEYRARRAGFTGSLRTSGKLRDDGWMSYDLGEVLAFGPHDSDSAFEAWMQSYGHKKALLETEYDVAGFAQVGTIWVGMFGNSRVSAPAPKLAATPQPVRRYAAPQQQAFCTGPGCGQSSGDYSSGGGFRPLRRLRGR